MLRAQSDPGWPLLRQRLAALTLAILLINLLAWWVGEKIFVDEARQMDRNQAVRQAELISNLLERESTSLRRIILGRALRLETSNRVNREGLDSFDFDRVVTEVFLFGANIDAYLVADSGQKILYSVHSQPTSATLPPLSTEEQQHLLGELQRQGDPKEGFAGIAVSHEGGAVLVAGVPVGRFGWILAQRDLDPDQVARYSELVGRSFELVPLAEAPAAVGASLATVEVDEARQALRWWVSGLSGRPMLQLSMAYERPYEQHMAGTVLVSRVGLFLVSLAGGVLVVVWGRYRQLQEQRLVASRREVERVARLAVVGELAAGVAHEINNPNGMIQRNLEFVGDVLDDALPLLAERADAGRLTLGGIDFDLARSQLPQLLTDMTRGSRRIGEIVRDLKDFARDDSPDNMGPFDVNEAVAVAARLLDGAIRKATDEFRLELTAGLPAVTGNLRQIEQVVVNLVQNACLALPTRDRAVSVTTRCGDSRRFVIVEVADEGVGMDAPTLEKIFDPFFTTRRESGGTGLGLSVSLRIVKRHGGKLDVVSAPGRGTTLTLTIPVFQEKL